MSVIQNSQVFLNGLNSSIPAQTVNGTISGSATWSMPCQGDTYKKVVIYCDALNGVAVVTFPVPFQHTPANLITSNGLDTINVVSTTQTTITGITSTGFIIIEGF